MKKNFLKIAVLSVSMLIGGMGILTSCNNNSSSTPISNSSSTNSGTSSQGSFSSQVVKVEDIKISLDNNELKINQEKQINLTILPTNATNQKVTYTVSNDVVTVSTSGLIKANKAGTSVITATSEDGKKTSSLNVYVSKYQNEYSLEAEDASLSGCVISEDANGSNGKVVGQISNGSKIEYTIFSEKEQTTDLKVVTSVVGNDRLDFDKYFVIQVNGITVETKGQIEVSENYGYSNYGKIIFNDISLTQGKNVITLTGKEDIMTNFDKLVIKADNLVKFYVLEIEEVTGENYYFEEDVAILQAGKSGGFRKENNDNARNKVALGNAFNNEGATITYKLNAFEATKATMFINMAIGGTFTDNPFKISLNDADLEIPTSYKDSQGNWTHFKEYKVALLNLIQGENVLVITITGGCGNFDYVKLVSPKSLEIVKDEPSIKGTEYRFEAEHAKIENCAVNSENNGSSGGNQVGGINSSSKITYDITSSNKQTVSLKLRIIIAGSDRLLLAKSFVLKVNDQEITSDAEFTSDGNYGWSCWGELVIENVNLNEGNNVIVLQAVEGVMTNVDCISIYAENDVYFTNNAEKTAYRFEGSDAKLTNCSIVSEDNGASGGSHVGQISGSSIIEYEVSSSVEQFVDLKVVTAVAGEDRLPINVNFKDIKVNDYALFYNGNKNITCPTSYGWGNWGNFEIKGVHLKAGVNKITLDFANDAKTNFDYIEINSSNKVELYVDVTGESYIFEGETATVTNGIFINDDANASGGKTLGGVCNNYNATITYKLNASEATKAKLYVCMALGGQNVDNPFNLKLNDKDVNIPTNYQDANANWAHYVEFELGIIDLVSGENILTFTITGGCGNFDYIKLVSPKNIA